jgi:hypothetical protein
MNIQSLMKVVRTGLIVFALAGLAECIGFFLLQGWVTSLVPWGLDRLAGIFLASICAAFAVPMLWIAYSEEYAALAGGAINFAILFGGFAAFSFKVYAATARQPVLAFGIVTLCSFLLTLGLAYLGSLHSFQDTRPAPLLVRISFLLYFLNLILTGTLLVLSRPAVFPWQLTHQQSVLYGWIFLGASTYFLYGFLHPVMGNATGQMLGFLAYDLVLIVPFLGLFSADQPILIPNLVYYIVVLAYSGLTAIYYLFLDKRTRLPLGRE